MTFTATSTTSGILLFLVCFCLLLGTSPVLCDREHKVHNIVLYPERHSWCQTTPIKQVIAMPGYESATIDNNVCVGACYSYSIPRTEPAEPGELIGPYCDSCQPIATKCYHATLNAAEDNKDGPKSVQKRVQIIMNCSCMSCEKSRERRNDDCAATDENTSKLPMNLFDAFMLNNTSDNNRPTTTNRIAEHAENETLVSITSAEDVPELLHIVPKTGSNNSNNNQNNIDMNNTNARPTFELSVGLVKLLKAIQEESDDDNYSSTMYVDYDKHQLQRLLAMIEEGGTGTGHELNDKKLAEFVDFFNSAQTINALPMKLDGAKLRDFLVSFRDEQQLIERHKAFGLGGATAAILKTTDATKIKHDIDMLNRITKYGAGGGGAKVNFLEGSHHGLGHLKGAHIAMGIGLAADGGVQDADQQQQENEGAGKGAPPAPNHILHHVDDQGRIGEQMGHLVKGPHGALVFKPDLKVVEEKLNIDSRLVKPNTEGLEISYVNHPKN